MSSEKSKGRHGDAPLPFLIGAALLMAAFSLSGCVTVPEVETACLAAEDMVTLLQDKYGEIAIWIGQGETGYTVLYLAPTMTWSVVTFTEELACLDRAGSGFNIRGQG